MKVLLDTNVVLDKLAARKPFNSDAEQLFMLIAQNKISGYVTSAGVTDIYYILRKNFSDKNCRDILRRIFGLLYILPVTQEDCEAALGSALEDFEDALIQICAEKAGLDFVITRDETFLKAAKTISPAEFLSLRGMDSCGE